MDRTDHYTHHCNSTQNNYFIVLNICVLPTQGWPITNIYKVLVLFLFLKLLCNLSRLGTCYEDQIGLELTEFSLSLSPE